MGDRPGWMMGCALTVALAARLAAAQPAGPSAEPYLSAARDLLAQGKKAEACAQLEAGKQATGSMEVRVALGKCYEAMGKTASAYAEYFDAATSSGAAESPELAKTASARAAALEDGLCKLRIITNAARVSGAVIKDNGTVVPPSLWGKPIPVDPGPHDVTASAPSRAGVTSHVDVGPCPSAAEVRVSLEDIPHPVLPGTSTAHVPSTHTGLPPRSAPESAGFMTPGRAGAVVLGAVGLIGLSAGIVFGVEAQTLRDSADTSPTGKPHCNARNQCDAEGLSLRAGAKDAAIASTVGFAAGGAMLAGGVLLWLFTGPKKPATPAGSPLKISASPWGVSLRGSF